MKEIDRFKFNIPQWDKLLPVQQHEIEDELLKFIEEYSCYIWRDNNE